jgi:hypothetical protein
MPEVGVQEIEVVLIDEPMAEFQVVTAALAEQEASSSSLGK